MEHEYGLIGGNIFHGELSPDQLFHMRPAPGYADFTTPIDGPLPVLVGDPRRRRRDRHPGPALHPPHPRRRAPPPAGRRLTEGRRGSTPAARPVVGRAGRPGSAGARARPRGTRVACCPPPPTSTSRAGVGAPPPVRRRRGSAPGASTTWRAAGARRAVAVGDDAVLARARRRRRAARVLQRVPAPRPRAAPRAARRPSTARSTAPTTGGGTGSTARCCRRRASRRPPGFDRADHGLVPVAVEEWHGWVMVNARRQGTARRRVPGRDRGARRRYEPERLVVGATHRYEIAANWKLVVENYQECFHCPNIHPELCRGEPADERRQLRRPRRAVGRRLAGPDAPRRHDVARRASRRRVPLRGLAERGPAAHRLPRPAARTCSSACTPTT